MKVRTLSIIVYSCFIVLLVSYTLKTRVDAERSRVFIVSDSLFYEQVIKNGFFGKSFGKEGYKIDFMVIDEHDLVTAKVAETFAKIHNDMQKEDTILVLMSPVISYYYVQYGDREFPSLHYKPVIVGFGSFADTSKFDFVYRADITRCFGFRQMFGAKILMVYSSSNAFSKEGMDRFEKWPNDKVVDHDTLPEKERENLKDIVGDYSMVLTPGFEGLYLLLCQNKLPVKIVMPYTFNLFSDSDARYIGPDIEFAIRNSLDGYNRQGGCVVEDTRWCIY